MQNVEINKLASVKLTGKLSASATEVDITGCGTLSYRRHKMADCEIRHRLKAKIILFSDGAQELLMISADECTFRRGPAAFIKKCVESNTGIPAPQILLSATHAHSTHDYTSFDHEQFASLINGSIKQLRNTLRPVGSIAQRSGVLPDGAIVNRRLKVRNFGEICIMFNDGCDVDLKAGILNARGQVEKFLNSQGTEMPVDSKDDEFILTGPTDNRIFLWTLLDDERQPIAAMVRVNAHAVTVSQSRVGAIVSADYIRYLEIEIKNSVNGAPCLTFNGAFGDTRPLQVEYNFDEAERIGRGWAGIVLAGTLVEEIEPTVAMSAATVTLPLRSDLPHDRNKLIELSQQLSAAKEGLDPIRKKRQNDILESISALLMAPPPNASGVLVEGELETGKVNSEWQAWEIGPMRILCLPGEPFVEVCRDIENVTDKLVVGISNGYVSYLPTATAFKNGGYEVNNSLFDERTLAAFPMIAKKITEGINAFKT